MTASSDSAGRDKWAEWLLHQRHGGDPQRRQEVLDYLYPIRDTVLAHAGLSDDEVLLDVGCGDGLIAFGALERCGGCTVILSDVSADLLRHARALATQMNLSSRCRFVEASADDLRGVHDASVDAVTTRSVLIYVAAKQRAFSEFHRVLKPGGRLSIFEPINRFGHPEPEHMFWGFDVTPVRHLGTKVRALYGRLQPLDADPMMHFDERDMIAWAEGAGFRDIHLQLQVEVRSLRDLSHEAHWTWDVFLRTPPNPTIPSLEDAMRQVLTPDEAAAFTGYLRPLVEAREGTSRSAVAYLWAKK